MIEKPGDFEFNNLSFQLFKNNSLVSVYKNFVFEN